MDPFIVYERRHLRQEGRYFTCTICNAVFTRYRAFDVHTERHHMCKYCLEVGEDLSNHHCEREPVRGAGGGELPPPTPFLPENLQLHRFVLEQTAHLGILMRLRHIFTENIAFVSLGFSSLQPDITGILQQLLDHFLNVHVRFILSSQMIDQKTQLEQDIHTASPFMRLLHPDFIPRSVNFARDYIIGAINTFNSNGSGWSMNGLISLQMEIGQYDLERIRGYIEMPKELKKRFGHLNINNKDREDCFKLCILAAMFGKEVTLNRVDKKRKKTSERDLLRKKLLLAETYDGFENKLLDGIAPIDFTSCEATVNLLDLDAFEERNKISINVYSYTCLASFDDGPLRPRRITTKNYSHHVNLLLLSEVREVSSDGRRIQRQVYHFVLITDIALFLHYREKGLAAVCRWCLCRFPSALNKHELNCKMVHKAGLKVKQDGDRFKFTQLYMKLDCPFKIYYDFEALNRKYLGCEPQVDPTKLSWTRPRANQQVSAFGLSVEDYRGNVIEQVYYSGENVMEQFFTELFRIEHWLLDKMEREQIELRHTLADKEKMRNTSHCEECGGGFTLKNHKTLHHHHYLDDVPKQVLCNDCNLAIRHVRYIPTIAHNATKYDHHFIVKSLAKKKQEHVKILARNTQHFMSLTLDSLRFIDSINFLPSSLEKLVQQLYGSGSPQELAKFAPLYQGFNNHPHVDLLLKKQSFPYEWYDSSQRHDETRLPPQSAFASTLREGKGISDADYAHAQLVWEKFECKTFKDYVELYLKVDVLLLQSVFSAFVKSSHETYGLSPAHCYSLPGYTYACAMYYTRQNWEYMTQADQIQMIMDNIRGGLCFVNKRISTAKSERLGDVNVSDAEREEILYIDCINLYGSALLTELPHSGFRWLTTAEIERLDIANLDETRGRGFIFEVDIEYDEEAHPDIHYEHNDLPMMPSKEEIVHSRLSREQVRLAQQYSSVLANVYGGEKLMLTFEKKEKYAVYYKLLKYYITHGARITKIHRVLTFTESPLLRSFIQKNIDLRKSATDEFSRSLFKLFINAVFGKCLNVKPKTIVKYCDTRVDAKKFMSDHNFKDVRMLDDDVSLMFFEGESINMNKPYIWGMIVLDMSKLTMYKMLYDVLKPTFGSRLTVNYGDTDSFIASIKDPNRTYTQDLQSMATHFDFSNLGVGHSLYSTANAGVPGKFKIEHDNIRQFVGIKSKMYSLLFTCSECGGPTEESGSRPCSSCTYSLRAKGIPRATLAKRFSHASYLDCLQREGVVHTAFHRIQAREHIIDVKEQSKAVLHNLDLRRFLLPDGINTLAFGHRDIPLYQAMEAVQNVEDEQMDES